ncbi:MAG TPA: HDOD domain-containing protein [Phycisphaerales bacterium]
MSVHSAPTPRQQHIDLIRSQVASLPPLAPVASRLMSLENAQGADLGEIARVIETDPVLSGRILGLCRRADKGIGEKITSIRRAVVLVGLDAVRNAALGASAFAALTPKEPSEGRLDRDGFWQYCVCVASTAELLALHNRAELRIPPEEAFIAGMLHAVGKLVLDHVLPKAYARVIELARQECTSSDFIERRVLGIDYREAGRALAAHWDLPPALASVMVHHATPYAQLPECDEKTLIGLVSGSAALVRSIGLGWSGDFDAPPSVAIMLPTSGVRPPVMKEFGAQLLRAVSERLTALGIADKAPEEFALHALQTLCRENLALLRQSKHNREGAPPPERASVHELELLMRARKIAESGRHAAELLQTIVSRSQILAMRLTDARDRASMAAIVSASQELEQTLAELKTLNDPAAAGNAGAPTPQTPKLNAA